MILYLDTSAFMKLYLEEPGSRRVRRALTKANTWCTHLIAYAEMRAGFAQAVRMQRLSDSDRAYQVGRFEADWQTLAIVAADEPLIRRAGYIAAEHGLRGYDSMHLAAAERVFEAAGRPATFVLAAFDGRLCQAAQALGMNQL